MLVAGGSTNITTYFALRLAADGTAATALTITGIDLQYVRSGAAPSAKVDATALAATDSAHGDNQAIEIDATDQPGLYRVDWPDAAFAAGVREVILSVKVATAFTEHLRCEINAPVDAVAISGSTTAADNVELQYDTTGLTGDTFPATQAQVGAIGTAGGGALNFEVEADNASSSIKGVSKVGTQTGTFANTEAENGAYHVITHATNVIDWIYQIGVGGGRMATEAVFKGFLTGSNDTINVQAYDFIGADWETRSVIQGQAGSSNITHTISLLSKHTGTGSDIGTVLLRFTSTATSHVLNVDELLVEAVSIGQTVGYELGRIWINTVNGVAGTENYVNGTADNPVSTLADALTLSASLSLGDFAISSDSTLTLVQDFNNANIYGVGYTLDFAGFDCAGTHFYHASPVDGIVTSANNADHVDILDSIVNDVTVDDSHFTNCSFKGTVTFGSVASNVRVINCRSIIAGASTPIFDFGTGAVNHNMTVADWQNGIEIRNFNVSGGGTDLLSISGSGQIVIAASCDGGSINLRGQWKITDNSGGAVTIVRDDVATSIVAVEGDTNELQGDWVDGGRLDLILDARAAEATVAALNDISVADILTTQMTEAYAANGVAPTLAQCQFAIHQMLQQFGIAGTALTVRKLDDTTTAFVVTLDNATTPTDAKRV